MLRRLFRRIQSELWPNQRQRVLRQWYLDGGDRRMRFDYDLNDNSLVLDLGGYEGQWASDIFAMYCCHIAVFEPVRAFARSIETRFQHNPKIRVLPFGLGGGTRKERISLCQDGSSIFKVAKRQEEIQIIDIVEWLQHEDRNTVDLMKVNIEGGEYELLERLIDADRIRAFRHIQVQFHRIASDSPARMERIQEQLGSTHHVTYQYPYVWESWTRNVT